MARTAPHIQAFLTLFRLAGTDVIYLSINLSSPTHAWLLDTGSIARGSRERGRCRRQR